MDERLRPDDLVRAGVMDAELAALVWLLLDARVPCVVVGDGDGSCDAMLEGLVGLLSPSTRIVEVTSDDDFDWLPEATAMGWRREHTDRSRATRTAAPPGDTVLVVRNLGTDVGVAGARARIVVRALALGYGLLATMRGTRLEDALDTLADPGVGTDPDERSRLGMVLVLSDAADNPRLLAAHYVRPVARDHGGHLQRPAPAVLASWSERLGRYDHFAWGVLADLAGRTGMEPAEFEREQARRSAMLGQAAMLGRP